jgi:3-methyladenine DNA glycosylase Tag
VPETDDRALFEKLILDGFQAGLRMMPASCISAASSAAVKRAIAAGSKPAKARRKGHDPLYVAYHDTEWGVPETDDRALFEKLILDGFHPASAPPRPRR